MFIARNGLLANGLWPQELEQPMRDGNMKKAAAVNVPNWQWWNRTKINFKDFDKKTHFESIWWWQNRLLDLTHYPNIISVECLVMNKEWTI